MYICINITNININGRGGPRGPQSMSTSITNDIIYIYIYIHT